MKYVVIEMEDGGIMKGELYPEVAPKTVENFVQFFYIFFGNVHYLPVPGDFCRDFEDFIKKLLNFINYLALYSSL